MKKISFIIPVLNESSLIAAQLARLQDYRRAGHELLVVDGGSTDDSVEQARALADTVLTTAPGRSLQMNAGAAAASGELLVFLHVDTELPAAADQHIGNALSAPGCDWGWFRLRFSNPDRAFRLIASCMNWRARLTFVCTGDQTLFVSAALFEQVGGFPPVALMEDVAICKLLRRKSTPGRVAMAVTASSRRWQQRGLVPTVLLMWWLRLLYFLGVSPGYLQRLYYPPAPAEAVSSVPYPRAHIAVLAREPVLGQVKTRLVPPLAAEQALALHCAMTTRALALVQRSRWAGYSLWVSSNPSHEYFLSICNKKKIYVQEEGDLGHKMRHCAEALLARPDIECLIMIGTDCPALTPDYLTAALHALDAGSDVVLGPASDGGYVLIGLRQARPQLFTGIDWGTATVLAQTVAQIQAAGLQYALLETLWDVDEAADLQRLQELEPPLQWP